MTIVRPLRASYAYPPQGLLRFCTHARLRVEGVSSDLLIPAERRLVAHVTEGQVHAPSKASSSATSSTGTHLAAPDEPYFVRRTHTKNLPVFHQTKSGGNLRQTKIKKIEGDIVKLQHQLQEELQLDPKDVAINYLTRHIIIKVCQFEKSSLEKWG